MGFMAEIVDEETIQTVPTLTLAPMMDDAPTLTAKPVGLNDVSASAIELQPDLQVMDTSVLSEEELSLVNDFAESIDVRDSGVIMQYGAGTQKKMADFSEDALARVRTKDLGETGDLISGVVLELKNFDTEDEKGLFGFFKKAGNKIETLRARYDKAERNIEKIVKQLQDHQVQLMKDSAMLDKMYDLNLTYYKELTMYILAGKKKLQEVREGELAELISKADASGRAEDAQAAQDLESMCLRFEKKLSDLDLTRTIALQTAPQIRLVQSGETTMVEKIQTTLVNTIPLWKSQMVLALGIANSEAAVRAQNAVTEATNNLLRKNADMLQKSTTEIARESERGVVDIETLQHTNEALIKTFDEVIEIQREGREKRAAAEVEMRKIEAELKAKLLEVSKQSA
jgi:uncharacterized protein YaaN involved in tellurite resistance